LDIFKIAVADDPGPFRLGDARYWKAMETGRWKHLRNTFDNFIAQKPKYTDKEEQMKKKKSRKKAIKSH